jgi:acetyl-CoA decarbonylase/synthase complex subunit gamma
MNVFADPQKPVQVEPKVYSIGEPNANSPLMFTTNFSLTYYTVESDVEASRIPSYILVVDTEGTSVLTAYSGDKLNEKTVSDAMTKHAVEGHKLGGYGRAQGVLDAAQISAGSLEVSS